MPVSDIAATQHVTFHFAGGSTGYLLTSGFLCTAFRIMRIDGSGETGITLALPYQCGCECPSPPDVGPQTFESLSTPMERTVTWDARELTTCWQTVHSILCDGITDGGLVAVPMTGWRPLSAGHFRAEFAIIDAPPSNCSVAVNGTGTCSRKGSPHYAPTEIDLCLTGRTRHVEFDLPAAGDVDVTVP